MDHFAYSSDGRLMAEEVALSEIAAAVGTPFYCYSTATLLRHMDVFAQSFRGLDRKICYAVKANSNVAIIKTLAAAGAGADVVSQGEIMLALKAGIKPQDIVFSGVGKSREEMAFALEHDIFQFNVESAEELAALAEVASSKEQVARIALRVNPDVDPQTHKKISTGNKETKFGIPMAQARELYAYAATMPAIRVQGVSVHIGSQLTSLEPFREAFAVVAALVADLRAWGHNITTLDLGGGLGIPYNQSIIPPLPAEYGEMVKEVLGKVDCLLIFEPGRMIVGNAGILVSSVIYVKDAGERKFAIIDAAMNDLLRPAMYCAHHDIIPLHVSENGNEDADAVTKVPLDVVGAICETADIFAEQLPMPLLQAGDMLAIRSAGAYGAVMSNNYNSRLLVPEVLVNGADYAVIRPRQSYEQLLQRDIMPQWLCD